MKQALIIDDSRVVRMILRSSLESLGFQVYEADNGREGVARLEGLASLDVVLVDWHMPEMTGLEFVREVRTRSAYAELPVVVVSAEQSQADIQQAYAAGASAMMPKPFTAEIIREKMSVLGVGG